MTEITFSSAENPDRWDAPDFGTISFASNADAKHAELLFNQVKLEAFNAGMTRAAEICEERGDYSEDGGAYGCYMAIIKARDGLAQPDTMKRFVVMSASNDGGEAVIVDSLESAADYIRKQRENEPPFEAERIASQEEELAQMLSLGGDGTFEVWGNPAWKERFYVSVLTSPDSET